MRLMLRLCVLKPVVRQHGVGLLVLQTQVRNLSERSLRDRMFMYVCEGRPGYPEALSGLHLRLGVLVQTWALCPRCTGLDDGHSC